MTKKLRPLTKNQERFAQAVASGKTSQQAYRECYSTKNMGEGPVRVEAHRTCLIPHVAARIAELRAPVVAREESAVHMTLEQHLKDLRSIRDRAMKVDQYGAATSAEVARGKAAGIHVERSKIDLTSNGESMAPVPAVDYSKISSDALREILAARIDDEDS